MKDCCLEEAMNTVDVRVVPALDEEAALLRGVAERIAAPSSFYIEFTTACDPQEFRPGLLTVSFWSTSYPLTGAIASEHS
jgi:hypothetical protein